MAITNTSPRKRAIINTGPRKPAVTLEQVAKGLGAEIVGIKNSSDPAVAAHGARLVTEKHDETKLSNETILGTERTSLLRAYREGLFSLKPQEVFGFVETFNSINDALKNVAEQLDKITSLFPDQPYANYNPVKLQDLAEGIKGAFNDKAMGSLVLDIRSACETISKHYPAAEELNKVSEKALKAVA